MIKLDPAQLPPRVAAAILARGTDLPPLEWHKHPNRAARTALDAVPTDTDLLGCESLKDISAAAAVRALLYLWNGWPAEANQAAAAAPPTERLYVEAIALRQAGDQVEAKAAWQKIGTHSVFGPLATYVQEAIPRNAGAALKRLRETIEFAGQWEPYLFADVFDQAREGKLDLLSEELVRKLQCCEFELLLVHCLQVATGERIQQRVKAAPPPPPKPAARPRPKPQPQPVTAAKTAESGAPKPRLVLKPVTIDDGVGVLCPACRTPQLVPKSSRGQTARCEKCGNMFRVPGR